MTTCSAYFSLLSEIVSNAEGPTAKAQVAEPIKSTGQAMLIEAIYVAQHIGVGDQIVMQRAKVAMDRMVETINADPPNSLAVMHGKYGVPCDEPLVTDCSRPRGFLSQSSSRSALGREITSDQSCVFAGISAVNRASVLLYRGLAHMRLRNGRKP